MLAQGAHDRDYQAWRRAAFVAACSLAPWGFQGSPDDLLKPTDTAEFDALLSPEQEWDALMAKAVQKNAQVSHG